MIHPPPLQSGDRVAVVSPAGPVTPELLEDGIATLESWDLEVELDDSVYDRRQKAGYLAGGDQTRLNAVQRALDRPDLAAVMCSRGGYGTMRLLPHLDLSGLRRHPKLVVGFSDITALHLHLAGAGIASLHGPVVKSFRLHHDDDHDSLARLRAALFGRRCRGRDANLTIDGMSTIRAGTASGPMLGGNLSIVASMLATPYCPELNGAIVLLEDLGEEDYRLDRLLTTLRLATLSGQPAAIVLGDFTGCAGAYVDDRDVAAFVAGLAAEFDCPVVADFPAGHGNRNVPVPMGVGARLDAGRGLLAFERDAVHADRM